MSGIAISASRANAASLPGTQTHSDDFTRADAASLGANWTSFTGTASATRILSNKAQASATSGVGGAYWSANAWGNDHYAEVTLSAICSVSDDGVGPACRWAAGANTGYVLQSSSSETRIYKNVSGTFTKLGTDGPAPSTGDVMRLSVVGTTVTAYRNGTAICSSPVTDAAISSGNAGLWSTNPGSGTVGNSSLWAGGTVP